MSEPLAISLGQKFELERMSRVIDATGDPQVLQGLAKQLLQAWHSQKAATQWVMRQQLSAPATINPSDFHVEPDGINPFRPKPGLSGIDIL